MYLVLFGFNKPLPAILSVIPSKKTNTKDGVLKLCGFSWPAFKYSSAKSITDLSPKLHSPERGWERESEWVGDLNPLQGFLLVHFCKVSLLT